MKRFVGVDVRLISLFMCGFIGLFSHPLVMAAEITVLTEDVPPMQLVENNKITGGITVEIIQALFKEAGETPNIMVLPWTRAYKKTQLEPNTFIFSMIRNAERENQFQWVGKIYALRSNITSLKSDNPININKTSDLFNYMIGVSRGDFGEVYLRNIGLEEGKNLYLTPHHSNLWKMLYSERVDAVFTNDVTAKAEIIAAGLDPNQAHKIFEISTVSTDLYLATNLLTDKNLVTKLQQALERIKANGVLDEITERWRESYELVKRESFFTQQILEQNL